VARRRGSKPSTPWLLLWGVGLLISGALVGTAIQSSCEKKWNDAASVTAPIQNIPQDTQQDDVRSSGVTPSAPVSPVPEKKLPGAAPSAAPAPKNSTAKLTPQPLKPRIALIIDDLGHVDPALVKRLCSLNIPLTVAVLPFLPHSRDSVRIARSRGMEIILHMPMEPVGYPGQGKNPGQGAVLFDQSEAEVKKRVKQAMGNIPFAVGLNNHMGSRITPDRTRMAWILGEVKKAGWYFLDSRTEKDTVAIEVARELGIPALERNVFLDDSLDPIEMARQWGRALALARQEGQVAIIGHIHSETIAFLEKAVPAAMNEAIFIKASDLAR
jgi:polysaccharide deacetylase 2 family uncharacterized protein YibQ